MDDVIIEETMTFIARELGPMYKTDIRNNNGVLAPNQQFINNDLGVFGVNTGG